jgi:hypothetical protein
VREILRALGAAAATLLLAGGAAADVTVTSDVGLGGTTTSGALTPVRLDVASTEAEPVQLDVLLTPAGAMARAATARHVASVLLGPGGRKRFTVPLVATSGATSDGWILDLRARTASGDRPLLRHGTEFSAAGDLRVEAGSTGAGSASTRGLEGTRPIVAMMGDPGLRTRWLGMRLDDLLSLAPAAIHSDAATRERAVLVPVDPIAAPDVAFGWEGADAVVWISPDPAALGTAQAEAALLEWTAAGGRLVVAVTPDSRLPAGGATAKALPVVLLGHDDGPAGEVVRALALMRTGGRSTARLPVARFSPTRGEVIAALPDGRPLAVRAAHGLGSITAVAVDLRNLDMASTTEGELMAANLLALRAPTDPGVESEWIQLSLQPLLRHLRRDFLRPPPLWALTLGLVLYLAAIGPLDWWILKKRNALRRTVITFPVIVLVFTALAWAGSFLLFGGISGRTRVAWVDLATAPTGDADTVTALDVLGAYSPTGDTLELKWKARRSHLDAPWLASGLMYYGTEDRGFAGIVRHSEDGTCTAEVEVPLRSFRAVQARTYDEMPATLDAVHREEGGRRTVRVRNHFRIAVRDVTFVEGNIAHRVGDVPPGGTAEIALPPRRADAPDAAAPRTAGSPSVRAFPDPLANGGIFGGSDSQWSQATPPGADDAAVLDAQRKNLATMAMGATFASLGAGGPGARGAGRILRRQGVDLSPAVRDGRAVLLGWCDADPTGSLAVDADMDMEVVVVRRVLAPEGKEAR